MPLFQALGFTPCPTAPHKPWLWFRTSLGAIQGFRPSQLGSIGALATIHPDIAHWRTLYPLRVDGGVNGHRAQEALVNAAMAAGPYDPPEPLRPRANGRPKGSKTRRESPPE